MTASKRAAVRHGTAEEHMPTNIEQERSKVIESAVHSGEEEVLMKME